MEEKDQYNSSSLNLSSEDSQKDWWDNLSVNDKINIEQGLREVKKGQVISSKEFWKKFRTSNQSPTAK